MMMQQHDTFKIHHCVGKKSINLRSNYARLFSILLYKQAVIDYKIVGNFLKKYSGLQNYACFFKQQLTNSTADKTISGTRPMIFTNFVRIKI
jgi:hypothetical protein